MSLSENLQNLRKIKNMSQEELAEKLNVSRQAVSKWESGNGYPETEKIISICEIFDCSMDQLVKGKISNDIKSEKNNYDLMMTKAAKGISLGVALILLIVTIIVLLILVGVTINLALNNQGIFNKAKTATRAFKNAEEGEQSGLDVADREIAKYMPKGTSEGGNGSESGGGTSEAGQFYIASENVGFYAQSDGKLYSINLTTPTYYDKDFDLTYIRDDIKKFDGFSGAYLTNTNELYKYNRSSNQYEKVGDNVKEYYDGIISSAYITNSNELYKYNRSSNQYEKVGDNVKEYYGDAAYLTNTNELYHYNYNSNQYEKVVENVKEYYSNRDAYLTNTNELYRYYNYNSNQYEKVLENVKEYDSDRDAYLTNTNELYQYNYKIHQYKKVGENVKEYYSTREVYFIDAYLTNTNELYKYNYNSNQYVKVEVNVGDIKEFGKNYFITKNNKIRVCDPGLS